MCPAYHLRSGFAHLLAHSISALVDGWNVTYCRGGCEWTWSRTSWMRAPGERSLTSLIKTSHDNHEIVLH
eukprot:3000203-Lingulodinium_polyedra.AAC.1